MDHIFRRKVCIVLPAETSRDDVITKANYFIIRFSYIIYNERVAEWLRRLTRKPKVRTAAGSNPMLDSLVAVRNTSPGRPEPCEGNLVAVAGSCS